MRKYFILQKIGLIFIVIIIVNCWISQVFAANTTVILQLRWLHQFQFAGYYAALEKGYYFQNGLKVIIKEGSPTIDPVQEVINKKVDFAVGSSEIILHYLKGKPIVVLGAIFQHSPSIILSRKDSNISSPQNFIGKRLMLLQGTNSAELLAVLQYEGIKSNQITIQNSSFDINDLINKKTEGFHAYLTNEPYLFEEKKIPYSMIRPINYGIDFYGDCVFTNADIVKYKSHLVQEFISATYKGWEYAMEHKQEVIDLIISKYKYSRSRGNIKYEAEKMDELVLPKLIEIGHMNLGRWERIANIFINLKMISISKFDLTRFVYNPNYNNNLDIKFWKKILIILCICLIIIGMIMFFNYTWKKRKLLIKSEEMNALHESFLLIISHELRTPLNGILGNIELLCDTQLTPEQWKYIRNIKCSSSLLYSIVNDVPDFITLKTKSLKLNLKEFDLRDLIENINEILADKAGEKGLEFACVTHYEVPILVKGDPDRLQQILIKLIDNAIKFTSKGEVVVQTILKGQDEKYSWIEFYIIDTGKGMSEEQIKNIYDPFYQVDSSSTREQGGLGIGLTITKQLIEIMGGQIEVSSKEGKTTFWFSLKFEKVNYDPMQFEKEIPNIRGKKILGVCDICLHKQILEQFFLFHGINYEFASNNEIALEKLTNASVNNTPFNAVIIDYVLDDSKGEILGKLIKFHDLESIKNTIVILYTPWGQKGDGDRVKKMGFFAYFTKPVERSPLSKTLELGFEDTQINELITKYYFVEKERLKEVKMDSNHKILVVEDNITNQKLILKFLKKLGHQPDLAGNGEKAIITMEQTRYDLVLMDIQMPVKDGLEATAIIRDPTSFVLNKKVPIVAVTAHAMPGDKERYLKSGMDDYVSKPIKLEVLKDILTKYLN